MKKFHDYCMLMAGFIFLLGILFLIISHSASKTVHYRFEDIDTVKNSKIPFDNVLKTIKTSYDTVCKDKKDSAECIDVKNKIANLESLIKKIDDVVMYSYLAITGAIFTALGGIFFIICLIMKYPGFNKL